METQTFFTAPNISEIRTSGLSKSLQTPEKVSKLGFLESMRVSDYMRRRHLATSSYDFNTPKHRVHSTATNRKYIIESFGNHTPNVSPQMIGVKRCGFFIRS